MRCFIKHRARCWLVHQNHARRRGSRPDKLATRTSERRRLGPVGEIVRESGSAAPPSSRLFERVMCGSTGSRGPAPGAASAGSQFVYFGVADILSMPAGWPEPYGSALDAMDHGSQHGGPCLAESQKD